MKLIITMLNKLFGPWSIGFNSKKAQGFSNPKIRLTIWSLLSSSLYTKQNNTWTIIWSTFWTSDIEQVIENENQGSNNTVDQDSKNPIYTFENIEKKIQPNKKNKQKTETHWTKKITLDEVDFSSFEVDLKKATDTINIHSNFKDWSKIILQAREKIYQYTSTLQFDEWYKLHKKRDQFEKDFYSTFNMLIYSLWSLSEYDRLSTELDKTLALNIIGEFKDLTQVQVYSRIWFALSFLNNADLSVNYYDKAYNLYFEKETQIQNWDFSYNLFMRILTYKLVTIDQDRTKLDNIRLWASIWTNEWAIFESYRDRLDQIKRDFDPKIIDFDFNISQEENYTTFIQKYLSNKNTLNPRQDAHLIMFRRIRTNMFSIQYEYFSKKFENPDYHNSQEYLKKLDRIQWMMETMENQSKKLSNEKEWFKATNGPAHTEYIKAKILLNEWNHEQWFESIKKSIQLCLWKNFIDRDLALDIISYYLRYIDQQKINIDKEIIAIFLEKKPDDIDLDAAIQAFRSITKKNIDQKFGVITTMNTLYAQLEELNEELWDKNGIITEQYNQVMNLYKILSREYAINEQKTAIIADQRDSLNIIFQREKEAREDAEEAREKESRANEALNKSNETQKKLSYVLSFAIFCVILLLWKQIKLTLKERKLKEEESNKKQQVIEEIKNMAPNEAYYNHIYAQLSWLEWATRKTNITLYQQIWTVLDVAWHSKITKSLGQELYSHLIDESLQIFKRNNILHLETSEWDDATFTYHAKFPHDLEKQNNEYECQSLLKFIQDLEKTYQIHLPEKNKNNILQFLPSIRYKGYFSFWEITFSYLSGKFNYKWSMYNNGSRWWWIFQWRNGIVFFLDKGSDDYTQLKETIIKYLNKKWIWFRTEDKESDDVDGEIIQFYITPELYIIDSNSNIRLSAYNILKKDKTKDKPDTLCDIEISKLYLDKNWICYWCNFANKKLERSLRDKSGSKISLTINWKSAFWTYEPFLGRFCFTYIDPILERKIMMLYGHSIKETK